jgi:predicted site-specific integrase-resolvase
MLREHASTDSQTNKTFRQRTEAKPLFGISARAIQNWMTGGKLTARHLPGRWRFLAEDIEDFLQTSQESGR